MKTYPPRSEFMMADMRIRPFVDTARRLIMNSFIPVKKELFTESFNLFPTNEKE